MYRFIPPLIVLVPQDLYSSVDCVASCICDCSAKFREDNGFDPP